MMQKIKINSPKFGVHYILIDDEDYEKLVKYNWYIIKTKYTYYAIRNEYGGVKKLVSIRMHREIFGITDRDVHVDHKDHNGLNNTRENLMVCTNLENCQNSSSRTGSSSKYLGVSWHKKNKIWTVQIRINKKLKYLGSFKNEEDGAKAYDKAAKKYFNKFANLNFK